MQNLHLTSDACNDSFVESDQYKNLLEVQDKTCLDLGTHNPKMSANNEKI